MNQKPVNDNPFSDDDTEFDQDLDDMINRACDRVAASVTGHSQVAGPSGDKPVSRPGPSFPPKPAGNAALHSGGRRGSTGSSNLRYSETEKLCTDSPFQVHNLQLI